VFDKTERLHRELWARVPTAVEKDPREVTTGVFIESLNDVIDLDTERLAAMENHVRSPIGRPLRIATFSFGSL
jgi:hypothetical protein